MMFTDTQTIARQLNSTGSTLDDIHLFIAVFIDQNKNGPTLAEIGEAVGIMQNKSPLARSAVFMHLNTLVSRGIIELPPGSPNRVPGRIILLEGRNDRIW